jgi:DNA-binding XRE family transcriptional regulator
MAKRIRRTYKRQPRMSKVPQVAGDGAGLLLVASAIGHIAEASHNGEVQRRQSQLEAVLQDWQAGYRRMDHQFSLLRDACRSVAARLEQAERERREWLEDDERLASIASRLLPATRGGDDSDVGDFWLRPGGLKLSSARLEPGARVILVKFAKGRAYGLPVERLGYSTRVVEVKLDDVRHGLLICLEDGTITDVASDFVLLECDQRYRAQHTRKGERPSIGQHIRQIRIRQGRSGREVAEASGLAPPNLARLEAGRHEPKLETLLRVAKALRVPLADLLQP